MVFHVEKKMEELAFSDYKEEEDENEAIEGDLQLNFELFKRIPCRYTNVIGEFADVEVFTISVDSLLIELTAHKYDNWKLGGQTVVLCRQVDRFLESLEKFGVWFSDLVPLFDKNPYLSFLHSVLSSTQDIDKPLNIKFRQKNDNEVNLRSKDIQSECLTSPASSTKLSTGANDLTTTPASFSSSNISSVLYWINTLSPLISVVIFALASLWGFFKVKKIEKTSKEREEIQNAFRMKLTRDIAMLAQNVNLNLNKIVQKPEMGLMGANKAMQNTVKELTPSSPLLIDIEKKQ